MPYSLKHVTGPYPTKIGDDEICEELIRTGFEATNPSVLGLKSSVQFDVGLIKILLEESANSILIRVVIVEIKSFT